MQPLHHVPPALSGPIAVFDAGIGSYAAVAAIRARLPAQDIVYFADRASFPYGAKSREQLLGILKKTLVFLAGFSPSAILVASNAPSITVLDDLMNVVAPPVFGVRPPIAAALDVARGGHIAVLGVRSMVESQELRIYVERQAGAATDKVHLINASALVDLVETGAFLTDPAGTQATVAAFLDDVDRQHPGIKAITLSSTHLPWLKPFFEASRPGRALLDPLDDAIEAVMPHRVAGSGRVLALVTESEHYTATQFAQMLRRIGVELPLQVVET